MAFAQHPEHASSIELLQRSLARGRLGHAYLFCGDQIELLESIASNLVRTVNCAARVEGPADAAPPDCCDVCTSCRKIAIEEHPDVMWVRPESKSRIISIDQIRELIRTTNLKPALSGYKAGIICGADRMNVSAANAFLKTLEEPPPRSILILLSTDPSQLLETILSRCLRLTFAGDENRFDTLLINEWLAGFAAAAVQDQGSLISRYRLLSVLLKKLTTLRADIEKRMSAKSPLERYEDVEKEQRDKWEVELAAAVEAEYRRQRGDVAMALEWWMRDIWRHTLGIESDPAFPRLVSYSQTIAARITTADAMENLRVLQTLQRLLGTNVQESLVLEVGLLKLKL